MAQVLIRNVPDDVVETYKVKAEIAGKSLEQVLRELLIANAPFTSEECLAVTERFHGQFGSVDPSLTKDEIREGLE